MFRTSQRSIEKEFAPVQNAAAELKKSAGVESLGQDEMLSNLDSMITRVEGLKRKVSTLWHTNSSLLTMA